VNARQEPTGKTYESAEEAAAALKQLNKKKDSSHAL